MTELAHGSAQGWNVLPSTGSTWTWSAWSRYGCEAGSAPTEREGERRARAALARLRQDSTPRRA